MLTWRPFTSDPTPVSASNFSGLGVNVGIIDLGFGLGKNSHHAQALSDVMEPDPLVMQTRGNGDVHGAVVARIIAGKQIGDGYGEGVARGIRLYASADVALEDGPFMFAEFNSCAVKIINNSWREGGAFLDEKYASGGAEAVVAEDRSILRVYMGATQRYGQLFIWAAGNKQRPEVDWPARYPIALPELEKGWLVVTSIHPDGTLKRPANVCGVAANWCLSAVEGNSGGNFGTSYATPVVTGVAALVSEAFPWMDNHALRQTLLSTADSIEPRNIYGWGRVNPDRAVRGPALFDSRLTFGEDFEADFNRIRSNFFNDIGGDRGLIKKGTGTLVLWGNNTYTGTTRIQRGNLELHGRVAGDVVIESRGTLYSYGGTVGGSLTNAGRVHLVGKGLHIRGDYVSSQSGAEVHTQMGAVFTVGGTAHLAGTKWYILARDPDYVLQKSVPLIQASKIVGQLAEVVLYGAYKTSVVYTADQLSVLVERSEIDVLTRQYFQDQSAWQAAATAVEASFTEIDRSLQGMPVTVSEAFVAQAGEFQHIASVPELATALESLTGEVYASSQAMSFQHAQLVNRALSHRVDALIQTSQNEGLWVNMLDAEGKLHQRGFTSADTRLFGAQLGIDHRLRNDVIIGAAFSWSESKAAFNGLGGHSNGQSLGLSLYGRYGAPTGNYLSGRIGHDWITTDVSRNIVIGATEHIDSVRHDGMTSTYVELGHVFQLGETTYTPYLGAEYNYLRRGAFQETGSAFALRATSASYQQGAVSVGMRYQSQPIAWAGGDTTLSAAGAYQYGNPTSLDFIAAFNGAPAATFELRGIGLSRHSGWLGVGATTRLRSRNLSWFINVDSQLDARGIANQSVSAGLRYEFD